MNDQIISIEGITVNMDGSKRSRIEIDKNTGLISKILEPTGIADVVLEEELIFPGFIDLHVHARECVDHSQDYKEDFNTARLAAINGGVVAFLEMPNNPTPPIDDESYKAKKELIKYRDVEVLLYAGIGEDTKPLSINIPYKVYMGPSVGTLFFKSLSKLEEVLSQYKGCYVSFHCEDPKILEENEDKQTHSRRRPKTAEISAVDFALEMIKKYQIHGKICHISTKEGIDKIRNAKKDGVDVVVEVSPHHLFFDDAMLTDENKNWMQMNPPLRPSEDRKYLIEALREGVIDFIATDHAPHTKEEKIKGTSGTPQLDTYALIATWLMKQQNFTKEQILKVCSYNPGKFINNFTQNKYGEIREGYTGSLAVLDMNKELTVTKDILKTKCAWSTYEGITFPGSVAMTIIKGQIYDK